MSIEDILGAVSGVIVTRRSQPNNNIHTAFASDLMSDVLTLDTENMLLITGLSNLQTIRTAEMSDINFILLVRNKKATAEMIELAEDKEIIIIESSISMYHACGILFGNGLKPVY